MKPSCLTKITDEIFVRKSDVLAVQTSGGNYMTRIVMKHQAEVLIPFLTPQQVIDKLNETETTGE